MDNFVITNSTLNKKQKFQTQSDHLVMPEIANENSIISTNNCYIFDGQFFSIIKEENKNILAQMYKSYLRTNRIYWKFP